MSNRTPFEIRVYAQHTLLAVEKVSVSYESGVTRLHIDAVATWPIGADAPKRVRKRIVKTAKAKPTDEIPVS